MCPKVSIIVPVYKAEKYLHKCVDSLLAQTFRDFEILLIDDGSPDKSGNLCDEYAAKDSRVRVIHKKNGGVSSARQCGIDNALGEYTIHADPDDWVEPDMLEELYNKAIEDNADMVICDYFFNSKKYNETKYVKQKPSELACQTVIKELFQQLHGSCCNKLVRRVCYSNYNIRFPEGVNYREDLYVCVALLQKNIKVSYLPKAFYHYVVGLNENSLSHTSRSSRDLYDEVIKTKRMFLELLIDEEPRKLCDDVFSCMLVDSAFWGGNYSNELFKELMYPYRYVVLKFSAKKVGYRLILFLSCIGLYRFMYFFSKKMLSVKFILKRFLNR